MKVRAHAPKVMDAIEIFDHPRVVLFTGAGMSAESGVPTYRGAGGIWGQYRWQDYACQRAFERDPQAVLDFHEQRRARVLACQPHPGYTLVSTWQRAHPDLTIVTQNTDGMHARSGARAVIELHGCLWRVRCARHGRFDDLAAPAFARRACPECGAALRPDITWFEDAVDAEVFARAESAVRRCTLFVAVGTSAVVWPAAGMIPLAARGGARMIEINPEDTTFSELFGVRLREEASVGLRALSARTPGLSVTPVS